MDKQAARKLNKLQERCWRFVICIVEYTYTSILYTTLWSTLSNLVSCLEFWSNLNYTEY
jgi:hypothetical protein